MNFNLQNTSPYLILSISYFTIAIVYFLHAGLKIKHKLITYLQNNHYILLYITGFIYITISLTYLYSYHHHEKHKHK